MNAIFTEKLSALRQQIDAVDQELIKLISQRATCVLNVGKLKESEGVIGGAIYRPEREAQILRAVQQANLGPLENAQMAHLFREIMTECTALEHRLSVAFLGPLGTFSESAAMAHFGKGALHIPQVSIDAVFRETAACRADFGMVPIENSTEGAIGRTMDLLIESPLKICGETLLRIRQNLLSNETDLTQIKKIYSHAQSLAQCQAWLDEHLPHAERIAVSSNAHGTKLAQAEKNSAAIAGIAAATEYKLPVLQESIEDTSNNTTRFIALGKEDAKPSGQDKTSIAMAAHNRTGALFALLAPFAEAGVSMTRLESRPSGNQAWEYVFFVDIEGHREDIAVKLALADLANKASWYKVLGSYPAYAVKVV